MNNEELGSSSLLEGIKLLKEWSNILLVVQTGAIGFIGTTLKDTTNADAQCAATLSVVCFVISILAAANLLASLPQLAAKSHEIDQFYDRPANLFGTIRLSAAAQGVFFVAGIIGFAFFAVFRSGV